MAIAFAWVPVQAGEIVRFDGARGGTIVIKTGERKLYYVLGDGRALRYPVGVGKAGKQWAGATRIDGKYLRPDWSPPAEVKRDKPSLPDLIPGGSPRNPMGEAALTLSGGQYAIHGTNVPGSVGGFVSYGCIRMYNHDIVDLYGRVAVGTPVVVLRYTFSDKDRRASAASPLAHDGASRPTSDRPAPCCARTRSSSPPSR
jgi:lipoprotein-anchoring transpeptidase ErfK/SrfK